MGEGQSAEFLGCSKIQRKNGQVQYVLIVCGVNGAKESNSAHCGSFSSKAESVLSHSLHSSSLRAFLGFVSSSGLNS